MSAFTRTAMAFLLLAQVALMTGCLSRPVVKEQAQVTASQMRALLAEINPQIDRTLQSMTQLLRTDKTEHGAAFAQYQANLNKLEEMIYPIRGQADRLRREGLTYFKIWSQEMMLADSAADRKAVAEAQFATDAKYKEFMDTFDKAAVSFRQLYFQFRDIEEYLAADLSNANIAAQKPLIDSAITRSADAKAYVDLVRKEIGSWLKAK